MPRQVLSTYRVQLGPELDFDAAAGIADYLAALGISHLYCSPYLQAAAGSTHGYDVVDPTRVSAELGGEAGHARMCQALAGEGLGQVLDIVPNHMAITGPANRWWWDVLENGPASRYASYFDVDWEPRDERWRNMVLLPILGDHFGRVLEAGELRLGRDGGRFEVSYHEHRMPVAPRSLDELLRAAAARCGSAELAFLADALGGLPEATSYDRESVARAARRHRDKEVLAGLLARLAGERPEVAAAVDREVAEINGDPDRLDRLLARQSYRLTWWRLAGRELDYRRFFDVHTLVGLRVEDERVFADTHALVLDWVSRGLVDGLRVDHPDGLYDPAEYCRRLRAAAPQAWLIVEKVLQPDERLPADWPVEGTTGYDFLNAAGGLFVDPAGEGALSGLYAAITGGSLDWPETAHACKLQVLGDLLAADVNRLGELFVAICEQHRRHRDHSRHDLRAALREVAAGLAVYRTYVRAGNAGDPRPATGGAAADAGHAREEDRARIEAAVAAAKRRRPDLPADLFDFLAAALLGRVRGGAATELAMRFQQLTAPAMAKGVEDTAFYVFNRLVALNEVGGDPGRFGVSPEEFHRRCRETAERWPRTLLATSTHDTKRGEDVRARLYLLSEIPERWAEAVRRWFAHNARHRGGGGPDAETEYLLYQTLVGAWPLDVERATAYMEKAAREAKTQTSWTRPDPAWEAALRSFIAAIAADGEFQRDLAELAAPLVAPGRLNSLAQTLLKLTAPGVPDLYQGCELWTASLVDPDNRRPVDYALRRRLLAGLEDGSPEEVLAGMEEGLPKLWLVRQALHLRRRRPLCFGPGADYRPLAVSGARAVHAVAFCRAGEVAVVVPRLVLGLAGDWGDASVELPSGPGGPRGPAAWWNELTAERFAAGSCRLADLLARFPVALLSWRRTGEEGHSPAGRA
ncbi:MAG TPA: malto-oligosyltrehalose synthase [Thermoanaerobaculia bacterium]|nr:malto-oligosyltrehalose synthase [Thermoanaerobaculia bacterium]